MRSIDGRSEPGAEPRARTSGEIGAVGQGDGAGPSLPVLVVAPQPVYEDRGTPIAVRQAIEALMQLGHTVELLTYPVGGPLGLEDAGLTVTRAPNPLRIRRVPIGLSWQKLALDVTLFLALSERLRSRRYSCIHAVEEAAFVAVVLGRRFGVPVIYDMQSSLPEQLAKHPLLRGPRLQRVLRRCERWLLRRARVVVSSTGLAARVRADAPDACVREWRFASEDLPVAAGEEHAVRTALGIADGAPAIVYSGTFAAYQGLPLLLEAIPRVRAAHPDAVFVLVGADEGHELEHERAAELVASGALRLVDRQPRERIGAYLQMADVLVSPRLWGNNLPLKIFDYLGAGRPIVATDIPTHRTLLSPERAMLVAPEPAAIADGITALLDDPARARALSAAGLRYAETHFGWDTFVESVAEIYAEVAGAGAEVVAVRG